jgi:hypothetical protein
MNASRNKPGRLASLGNVHSRPRYRERYRASRDRVFMTERIGDINKLLHRATLLIIACGVCVLSALFFPRDSLPRQAFSGIGYLGILAYCSAGLAIVTYQVGRLPRGTLLLMVPVLLCMLAVWLTVHRLTPERLHTLSIVLAISKWVINVFVAFLLSAATYGWTLWWLRASDPSVDTARTSSKRYRLATTTDPIDTTNRALRFVRFGEAALWFIASLAGAVFVGFEILSRIAGLQVEFSTTSLQLGILALSLGTGICAWVLCRLRHTLLPTVCEQHGPITTR